VTRQDKSQAMVEWMQGVVDAEEDLLTQIAEVGIQGLMEAESEPVRKGRPPRRSTSCLPRPGSCPPSSGSTREIRSWSWKPSP